MSYYRFAFQGIWNSDRWSIDFDFDDLEEGNSLRQWAASYDRETQYFYAYLNMRENADADFEQIRKATPAETLAMWNLIPLCDRLRFSLYSIS